MSNHHRIVPIPHRKGRQVRLIKASSMTPRKQDHIQDPPPTLKSIHEELINLLDELELEISS